MPSNFIGRYPDEKLVRYLLTVDTLWHAPDLPVHSEAYRILHEFLDKKVIPKPKNLPILGKNANVQSINVALLVCAMAESLGIHVTVTAGSENDEFLLKNGKKFINIAVGEPVRGLHELAHALFGLSEAVATAWSLRQLL
jgi:hypothetical protein